MMDGNIGITVIAAVIAASPGIIALGWRMRDRSASYLHIEVRVDLGSGNFATATTVVENRGLKKKQLDGAFLLIGPEEESILDTMYKITNVSVGSTNEIVQYHINNRMNGIQSGPDGRRLIPLDFYYSENVRVGDEKMSYRVPINTQNMKRENPYSVRFFICTPGRLHRSTQDCLILPAEVGPLPMVV